MEDWWKWLALGMGRDPWRHFPCPRGPGAPAEVPSLILYPWRPKTLQGCPLGCTEPKPHPASPARAFSGFLFYFFAILVLFYLLVVFSFISLYVSSLNFFHSLLLLSYTFFYIYKDSVLPSKA